MIAFAWWLALFGIWPIADPGHRSLEPMVLADVLLHLAGIVVLVAERLRARGWLS